MGNIPNRMTKETVLNRRKLDRKSLFLMLIGQGQLQKFERKNDDLLPG